MKLFLPVLILCLSSLSFSIQAEAIWIDVRTEIEHKINAIDGDLRITHTSVSEEVSRLFPDKDADIRLYCQRGGRAEKARQALLKLGYKNVTNAGGIAQVKAEREKN